MRMHDFINYNTCDESRILFSIVPYFTKKKKKSITETLFKF